MISVIGAVIRWLFWIRFFDLTCGWVFSIRGDETSGIPAYEVLSFAHEILIWVVVILLDLCLIIGSNLLVNRKIRKGLKMSILQTVVFSTFLVGTGQVARGEIRWAKYFLTAFLLMPFTAGPAIWGLHEHMLCLLAVGYAGPTEIYSAMLLILPFGFLAGFGVWDAWVKASERTLDAAKKKYLSGFLSFVAPGLGHAFCGRYLHARILMAMSACFYLSFWAVFYFSYPNEWITAYRILFLGLAFNGVSALHAYCTFAPDRADVASC